MIAMPMSMEAVYAYRVTVLAGCCVVGIADSFAPAQIRDGRHIAGAAAAVTQDEILRGSKSLPMHACVVAAEGPHAIVVPAQLQQGLQVCVCVCVCALYRMNVQCLCSSSSMECVSHAVDDIMWKVIQRPS